MISFKPGYRWAVSLLIFLPLAFAAISQNNINQTQAQALDAKPDFVTRFGSQLLLNGKPFRYSGANIYWLGLDENTGSISAPTDFRVDDALTTAKEMGATVIRAHTLGISVGCPNCIEPSLGGFNEAALVKVDYAVKRAHELGLKLIIPFVDNYKYYHGGKHTFTDWRGVNENQFYDNTQVINDFKQYMGVILNRVNTYTGIAYKDDPAIMAWETGNEIYPPAWWTGMVANYIKSIDPNHLVVDGRYGIDPAAVILNNVDIYSDHFYPLSNAKLTTDAALLKLANKPLVVGEYDWANAKGGDSLSSFLSVLENTPNVAGDSYWALLGHNDTYGFVQHNEPFTLHYPGDTPEMKNRAQLLRNHAFMMGGKALVAPLAPTAPLITSLDNNGTRNILKWQGVVGAATYEVSRSTTGTDGPWTAVCNQCATDNNTPWTDQSSPATGKTWYRVRAFNLIGQAGPYSHPSLIDNGSTTLSAQVTVDNLNDWSKSFSHSANMSFDSNYNENFEGDNSRARRNDTSQGEVVWKGNNISSFQATGFFWPGEAQNQFRFFTSKDGQTWNEVKPAVSGGEGNWTKFTYSLTQLSNVNFVKIRWNSGGTFWNPQIGRVTISSAATPAAQGNINAAQPQVMVDGLSDWSKTYSHSADLSFDTNFPEYFGGDSIRARRSQTVADEIVWKQTNLKSFEVLSYFWTNENVSDFSFYTSSDGVKWTAVKPAVSTDNGGSASYSWIKKVYSLNNLSGVNYFKVQWNNLKGNFWNPQISQVTLTSY